MNYTNLVPKKRFQECRQQLKLMTFGNVTQKIRSYPLSRSYETEFSNTKYIHYGDIHKAQNGILYDTNSLPNIVDGNYETLENGNLILADASEDYTGIAKPMIIQDSHIENVVAGLHTIALQLIDINPLFLYYLLQSDSFRAFGYMHGTGMKVFGISYKELSKFQFGMPSNYEQKKIGHFLAKLDKLISLVQHQITLKQKYIKALMQQMFPSGNNLIPNMRFNEFGLDWEKVSLNTMLKERDEKIEQSRDYPLMSFVQNEGVVPKGDRYNREFLVKDKNKLYKKTKKGDFIYSSNNLETGSIGFNNQGNAVISPVYSIFYSKNRDDIQFIGRTFFRSDFIAKMVKYRQGVMYGQWRIHANDFLKITLAIPDDKEKIQITKLFNLLDEDIKIYRKKEYNLKLLKNYYLKQLFC